MSEHSDSPKERRRKIRYQLSRDELLDAAEETFGKKGFHATTLKEIAERAEFSVPSIYSFFDSKEDLLKQVVLRRSTELLEAMKVVLKEATEPRKQLHELFDYSVGYFRRHPHYGRILLLHSSPALLSPERAIDVLIEPSYDEGLTMIAGVFERGQADHQLRSGDCAVLARFYLVLCSTYQALDPAIMSDDPSPEAGYPLEEFHDLIDAAFAC